MAHWIQELHSPEINIPITVDRIEPVLPDHDVTSQDHDRLYLSNLDDMIGVRVFTPTVYFYESKKGFSARDELVVQTLKDALSKVLVPYYPFSGRLRETTNGKLEVFFGPDRGALLVEAHADVALSDLGYLTVPNPAWMKLIYHFPDEQQYGVVNMPPVIAQVTRFVCGGFSLGLRMCHCLCDGFGAMQFLSAWARTAKSGSLVLNPEPCWDRGFFKPRDPPKIEFPHTEFKKIDDGLALTRRLWQGGLVQRCYRISRDYQARLKKRAQDEGGLLSFTTFDAMAAHVWRSWVRALYEDVESDDDDDRENVKLRLTFSVNARSKLENPPLRDGFYGNALCVACAASNVERVVEGRLGETARLVHEARLGVTEEYLRSTVDYIEMHRPEKLEFGGKLTITQWTRFSIYEVADFGWGKPIYAGPIDLTPTPQVCLFLPEAETSGGAMVVCICLPEYACPKFSELLMYHQFE